MQQQVVERFDLNLFVGNQLIELVDIGALMFVVVIFQTFLGQDRLEGVVAVRQRGELEHDVASLRFAEDRCEARFVPT